VKDLRALASPRGRHARRAAGGFTLLEIVIVAVLTSILFLLLIRWVAAMSSSAATTQDNEAVQRSAQIATAVFSQDVANSRPCAAGRPTPLAEIRTDTVSFYAAGDGALELITWQLRRPGTSPAGPSPYADLVRTVEQVSGCGGERALVSTQVHALSARAASTRVDYADGRAPQPAFYMIDNGQPLFTLGDPARPENLEEDLAAQQAWGPCSAVDHLTESRCAATAIGLDLTLLSPVDSNAPAHINRSFTFPVTGEGYF
jgi:type II secretory pathway pseudopilin PulG